LAAIYPQMAQLLADQGQFIADALVAQALRPSREVLQVNSNLLRLAGIKVLITKLSLASAL
jgi:hypothetical protein